MYLVDIDTEEKYTMQDSHKCYLEQKADPAYSFIPQTFAQEWANEIESTLRGENELDIAVLTYDEAHRLIDRIYSKLEKEGKVS